MTDALQTALIVAVAPTLASLAAIISSFRNAAKIQEVHLLINSRMEALLKLTKESSFAEGEKAQKDRPSDPVVKKI